MSERSNSNTRHPHERNSKLSLYTGRLKMGEACSTYGEKGEAYTGFWWGNLRERDRLGETGVDGRIILRWIFNIEKNEMCGACSTYGGGKSSIQGFGGET